MPVVERHPVGGLHEVVGVGRGQRPVHLVQVRLGRRTVIHGGLGEIPHRRADPPDAVEGALPGPRVRVEEDQFSLKGLHVEQLVVAEPVECDHGRLELVDRLPFDVFQRVHEIDSRLQGHLVTVGQVLGVAASEFGAGLQRPCSCQ